MKGQFAQIRGSIIRKFEYRTILSLLTVAAWCGPLTMEAQDLIIVEPLFEYPMAPEDLNGLQERSDYLMAHFWDPFDFNIATAIDQNALNDAFNVYVTAMRYADRDRALESVDQLVKKLKSNPVLLLQFAKAAEESLYGPRASIWSDEAYLPFLKAVVTDRTLSDTRKQRYSMQLDLLKANGIGVKIPTVRLTTKGGRHLDFTPSAPLTLIEFGNPDCDDCQFAKLKLSMASDIAEMIEAKTLGMAFIVADAVPEEQDAILKAFTEYPDTWITGICYGGDDIFDLRATPSFYLLDKDGKIIAKNLDVTQAVERVRDIKSTSSK